MYSNLMRIFVLIKQNKMTWRGEFKDIYYKHREVFSELLSKRSIIDAVTKLNLKYAKNQTKYYIN